MIFLAAEKTFENKIKKYLKDNECWFVKFFANSYTKVGVPDILACVNGYFVGIEVKASRGKPSELQKYNVSQINECNGIAIIVKPDQWDQLKELLESLLEDNFMEACKIREKINVQWI